MPSAQISWHWWRCLTRPRGANGLGSAGAHINTDAGALLLQRNHMSLAPPGSRTRQALTSLQAFLPLPGRTWTVTLVTASAHQEMTDSLGDLLKAVS